MVPKEQVAEVAAATAGVADPQKGISFNNIDYVKTDNGISQVNAPKNIERLEEISAFRNEQRKREMEEEDDNIRLHITDQSFDINKLDVHDMEESKMELLPELIFDEIEVLD